MDTTITRAQLQKAIEAGIESDSTLTREAQRKLRDFGKSAKSVGSNFDNGCPWSRCFPSQDDEDRSGTRKRGLGFAFGYDDALISGGVTAYGVCGGTYRVIG